MKKLFIGAIAVATLFAAAPQARAQEHSAASRVTECVTALKARRGSDRLYENEILEGRQVQRGETLTSRCIETVLTRALRGEEVATAAFRKERAEHRKTQAERDKAHKVLGRMLHPDVFPAIGLPAVDKALYRVEQFLGWVKLHSLVVIAALLPSLGVAIFVLFWYSWLGTMIRAVWYRTHGYYPQGEKTIVDDCVGEDPIITNSNWREYDRREWQQRRY